RHGYAEESCGEQHDRPSSRGAATLDGSHSGDLRSYRMDDAPAADQRTERDRCLANEHHPKWYVEIAAQITLGEEQYSNDAHRFLRVVAAMTQRNQRGGGKLQPLESRLYGTRICANKGPRYSQDQRQREQESKQRRQYDERAS